MKRYTIAVLGSHSALDICRGAKDVGFKTLVIAESGRDLTYHTYYRTRDYSASPEKNVILTPIKSGEGSRTRSYKASKDSSYRFNGTQNDKIIGCVDECLIVRKFDELLKPAIQEELTKRNVIFIPNRSFESYLHYNYKAIDNNFRVPMFGNKHLLKIEERGNRPNQYDILVDAQIRYPKQFKDPKKIDRLCLVKVLEKERGFERAFFLVENYEEYKQKVKEKIKSGVFTEKLLTESVIEEFVIGVQVNFNFFYSPLHERLELLGTDTRRQTNIEGFLKIPAMYQQDVLNKVTLKYEEAGHIAVTVLESMLEPAFAMGERFVKVCKKLYPPGVIGPFALQSIIIPGPPKKDIVVVDVSPRVPGSPGISATPYSTYLYGQPMSVGMRIAMEIKEAVQLGTLEKILT